MKERRGVDMKCVLLFMLLFVSACSYTEDYQFVSTDNLGASKISILEKYGSPVNSITIEDPIHIAAENVDEILEFSGLEFFLLGGRVQSIKISKPKYAFKDILMIGAELETRISIQIGTSDCYLSAIPEKGMVSELWAFCSD